MFCTELVILPADIFHSVHPYAFVCRSLVCFWLFWLSELLKFFCCLFLFLSFQVFEPFGPVELVQLPLDLETGQCKGYGFVQVSTTQGTMCLITWLLWANLLFVLLVCPNWTCKGSSKFEWEARDSWSGHQGTDSAVLVFLLQLYCLVAGYAVLAWSLITRLTNDLCMTGISCHRSCHCAGNWSKYCWFWWWWWWWFGELDFFF